MRDPLTFGCACGAVRGELSGEAAKSATRVQCHCNDCRAFQVACDRPDPGAHDGTALLHVAPAGLKITQGAEHLRAFRFYPRGLYRWHTECCNTPLAATLPSRAIPFAGLLVNTFDTPEAVGRIRVHGFIKQLNGQYKHKGAGRLARGLLSRTVAAYMRGEARTPPFRNAAGQPISAPRLIGKSRKAEIYASL